MPWSVELKQQSGRRNEVDIYLVERTHRRGTGPLMRTRDIKILTISKDDGIIRHSMWHRDMPLPVNSKRRVRLRDA